jgi:hypothetical protein
LTPPVTPGVAKGTRLQLTRLRATARSEWIKFRSVRSGPLVLVATALIVVVGAWLLAAGNRNSAAASLVSKAEMIETGIHYCVQVPAAGAEDKYFL